MRRVAVVASLAIVLVGTMRWVGEAQPQPQPTPDSRFTGTSTTMESKDLTIARRRFEAGARSDWHSHQRGQLLFVEQGRMRTQRRGEAVRELGVGQSDYTRPNVEHWHGAVPGEVFIQVNIGFGGETKWLEKVGDAVYNGK